MSEFKPDKNRVIVATASEARPTLHKAREVIYTYPKRGKITLVMRKAFNRMLQNAHQQGIDVEWYRLPIRRLANNIDYDSNDMKTLVSTVEAMQTTLIRWGEIDQNGRTTLNSVQLIGAVKFVGELRSDGRRLQTDLLYKFDDGVKERVFNSNSRALLNLDLQNQFKSSYTAALYEQLMEVVGGVEIDEDGWWRSSRLPWQDWRDLIMSADTSAYYDNIKYFNRDVLRKALAELEAFLDEYEVVAVLEKEGREYKHLSFQIRLRAQTALPLDHSVPLIDTSRAEKAMAEFGLNPSEIQEVLEAKDLEEIEGAIAYTRRRMEKSGAEPLGKPAAYFIAALRDKYNERAGSLATKLKKPAKADKASGADNRRRAPSPSEGDIKLGAQIAEGQTYFSSLAPDVQRQKLQEWADHEANAFQKGEFAKKGLKSTAVVNGFFVWLAKVGTAP